MINDIRDYLENFTYVFTKFAEREHNGIPTIMKGIFENLRPEEK